MSERQKIKSLFKENYLAVIENSRGTKMFRNFYIKISGKKEDNTKNGILSCAYFVSAILAMFGLINETNINVNGLVEEMRKCGWKKIKNPRRGSVLVWENKKFDDKQHKHIGFFIGSGKAISNSFKKKMPVVHHWTFGRNRKIEAIFWHKKLNKGQ